MTIRGPRPVGSEFLIEFNPAVRLEQFLSLADRPVAHPGGKP